MSAERRETVEDGGAFETPGVSKEVVVSTPETGRLWYMGLGWGRSRDRTTVDQVWAGVEGGGLRKGTKVGGVSRRGRGVTGLTSKIFRPVWSWDDLDVCPQR